MRTAAIIFFLLLCAQFPGLHLNACTGTPHYPSSAHFLSVKKQVTVQQSGTQLFWEENEDEESCRKQAALIPYLYAFAQAFLAAADKSDAFQGIFDRYPFLFPHTPAYLLHRVLLI